MKTKIAIAKDDLALAAKEALKLLSEASIAQLKTIASAAAEALKVSQAPGNNDHDLLVELRTKMQSIKDDIKELKDDIASRVKTLEDEKVNIRDSYSVIYKVGIEERLGKLEAKTTDQGTMITKIWSYGIAALFVTGLVEFFINKLWHP